MVDRHGRPLMPGPEWIGEDLGPGPTGPSGPTSPTGPSGPTAPVEPPPIWTGAADPLPTPALPIDRNTPFRSNLDCGEAVWLAEHTRLGSPIPVADQKVCYQKVKPWSALALAQSVKESECGKTAAPGTRNALNLFVPAGTGPKTYAAWADGFAEFYARMSDPHYKGSGSGAMSSVYSPRELSFEGWTATYVGGPGCWSSKGATCANNETWKRCQAGTVDTNSIELAIQQLVARVNTFTGNPQPTPWTAVANPPGCAPVTTPPSGSNPYKTERDILNMLSSNNPQASISFGYAERNPGQPIYTYGKGHMTAAVQGDEIHPGIDVWMPDETPVGSLFAGKVVCVGNAGTPMWGQGCGYFSDDNGGLGNITILHDVTAPIGGKQRQLKITYGHMSSSVVGVGDRIETGEIMGRSGTAAKWHHIHLDVVTESPELNNPQIWNNPGEYHLDDPIPTILAAVPMGTPAGKMVRFAGSSVDVPLDVPFRIVLIPSTQTLQRPGNRMTPALYVQHETGNPNPGMGAQKHLEYLQNGAPDNNGNPQQLGYHLTVDEKECIQMIPLDEITWHGGDGGGPCNMTGVACELCVQDNNKHKVKARENAEKVAAAVMRATNVTRLEQHNFCSGKNCPMTIRAEGYWPTFVSKVNALRTGS